MSGWLCSRSPPASSRSARTSAPTFITSSGRWAWPAAAERGSPTFLKARCRATPGRTSRASPALAGTSFTTPPRTPPSTPVSSGCGSCSVPPTGSATAPSRTTARMSSAPRVCSGDSAGQTGDLAHYSPGRHFSVWSIDGVACGALICYDYRFPELYREYKKRGVQLVFHSFHAARFSSERIAAVGQVIGPGFARLNRSATHTYPGITMPAAMTAAAAANHVWISCPNSSAPQSCWPAFFVRADGVTTGRLRRNVPGVLISALDPERDLYDLDRGLAGPRPGRCPAQRHRRQRPALRRPHPD